MPLVLIITCISILCIQTTDTFSWGSFCCHESWIQDLIFSPSTLMGLFGMTTKLLKCLSLIYHWHFDQNDITKFSWCQDGDALTHWGRVTHICVGKLTIIGSDNGLSPGPGQAIIWTNAGILLIGPLGTNFSEILIGIQIFSFKKIHFKMSSGKWLPSCLGLNVLTGLLIDLQQIST